jgi:PAS domain S-box-containing protein
LVTELLSFTCSPKSRIQFMNNEPRTEEDKANGEPVGCSPLVTSESQAVHEFADSMAHIAWTAAPDGMVQWFNRRFYEYTGLPEGAAVGWDWSVVIHPDDLQKLVEHVMAALNTGKELRVEARVRRHDGEMRWMLVQAVAVKGENGMPARWLGTATDIHARIEAEVARQQSEERLYAIIQAAEVFGIVLMEPDLTITEWNLGAENIFRWTRDEAVGKNGAMIFTPEDQERNAHLAEKAKAEGEGRAADERWHMRKDGSRLWGSGILTALYNEDGSTKGFVKILRDITDRKLMEEELERRVKERTAELQSANSEMQGFTYSVSHDLRAPLRAIVATSSILLQETASKLSDEEKLLLTRQSENANKLAVLIDDLLQLSRLSRQEMALSVVDLTDLVQSIVSETELEQSRVKVEEGLQARADPKLLRLAVQNLVQNAAQFSPDGGIIEIGSMNTTEGLAFYVRDSGIGFDMNYVGKLFLPFERLHNEGEYPGTGIGLANVRRIVERHGGRTWAESKGPGTGATFYFTLPEAKNARTKEQCNDHE